LIFWEIHYSELPLIVLGDSVFTTLVDSTTGFQIRENNSLTVVFNVDTLNERVGIGNFAPTVELDVTGDGKFSGGLVVDTDTLIVDAANNNVKIGGTAAGLTDLTIFQEPILPTAGNVQGITFSGTGTSGGTSTTEGVTIYSGLNIAGNTQFWVSNTVDLGDATKNSFRMITGADCPLLVGVNNSGSANKSLCFGLNLVGAHCGFGFPTGTAQAAIQAQVHANAGLATIIPIIAQGFTAQTADLFQARNNTSVVIAKISKEANLTLNALGSTTGAPRTISFSPMQTAEAARYQFADEFNCIQNAGDSNGIDIVSFHTLRLFGDRNAAPPAFSQITNIGVIVENSVAASIALVVDGASSQSADLFQARNSAGTPLFSLDAVGAVHNLSLGRLDADVNSNSGIEVVIGITDTSVDTITLQTVGISQSRTYIIKDETGAAGTNNITIATQASETIDGLSTVVISTDYGVQPVETRNYISITIEPGH